MHAIEFLQQKQLGPIGPMLALFGTELFLKRLVLERLVKSILGEGEDDECGLVRIESKTAELKDVIRELSQISMWGNARVVVVDPGDEFVTKNREGLEKYLDKPARNAHLILNVESWTSTTRLAKKLGPLGGNLDCSPMKAADLTKWLCHRAESVYQKKLTREGAQLMIDLAGNECGLLDQELAKLASFAGEAKKIEITSIRGLVGGWRAETTWKMLDAVRDGQPGTALSLLTKLLEDGEPPMKLLSGIQYSYRPWAQATEAARRGIPLRKALSDAGVRDFVLEGAERGMRRLGRVKAEKLYEWLIDADGDLKGSSPLPPQIILERLLLRLSGH